ncbi:DUF6287 domain-containing protein [Streptococcus vestibularis]|uniref:DUF6287 domain-containing protein n=1 Tax=Streptococcus vestibularis TaxID=1343 RepID=UPI0026F2B709|nr:DUF6287 domain-containing protein [Streptococcus vestibularis]
MKTTTKLIGILLALIVVILAIFLVTKFNSHESARVGTSSSSVQTVKKSSSSSSKAVKKDKKAAQSSAAVSSKENDNQDSAVAPKASSQEQNQTEGSIHRIHRGQVADSTAGTDKAKTEKGTDNSQSSLNFGALDNGDISSIVGTWTNANGESVTINADGTIIKNSTGYTAQLKPQGVSDNTFNASVVSQDDSVALSVVAGGVGSSDYLVIGANGPYYRN